MNQPYNEEGLLQLIAAGNEAAFAELFKRYSHSLGIIAYKILQDEAARQDVLQETFIKLWLHREQLPEVQFLPAWLKKITLNESLMYLRKNAARDKRLAALPLAATVENTAVQTIDLKELQRQVQDFIASQPEQRRTIYELNRREGLSAVEIARRLGLSHGHVRNTLSVIIKGIREHLDAGLLLLFYLFHLF